MVTITKPIVKPRTAPSVEPQRAPVFAPEPMCPKQVEKLAPDR